MNFKQRDSYHKTVHSGLSPAT